jgi:hypothetical protein
MCVATAKMSKEAKSTMQECVSEFIGFITSEASDRLGEDKRKTITGDDSTPISRSPSSLPTIALLSPFHPSIPCRSAANASTHFGVGVVQSLSRCERSALIHTWHFSPFI